MTTQQSKKTSFISRVRENVAKHRYTKVTATTKDGVLSFKTPYCVFTGYTGYWGSGSRQNHDIVYIPSLRLAGTPADLRQYIIRNTNEASLDYFVRGALTMANHQSDEQVTFAQFSPNAPLDASVPFTDVTTSYKNLFRSEVEWSEKGKPEGDRPSSQPKALSMLLAEINQYLQLSGEKDAEKAEGVKGAKGKGDKLSPAQTLVARCKETNSQKSLNVSGYDRSTVKGTRFTPRAVPANGIRLQSDPSEANYLKYVFFTLKKNPSTNALEVPIGVYHFLEDIGYSADEARNMVAQARAAGAAAGPATLTAPSQAQGTVSGFGVQSPSAGFGAHTQQQGFGAQMQAPALFSQPPPSTGFGSSPAAPVFGGGAPHGFGAPAQGGAAPMFGGSPAAFGGSSPKSPRSPGGSRMQTQPNFGGGFGVPMSPSKRGGSPGSAARSPSKIGMQPSP